jgi:hypothetical protein
MEIPTEPWEIISVDFITDLSESASSNCIMNIIDQHSKILYSGAYDTRITTQGAVRLFLDTAWYYKGLP